MEKPGRIDALLPRCLALLRKKSFENFNIFSSLHCLCTAQFDRILRSDEGAVRRQVTGDCSALCPPWLASRAEQMSNLSAMVVHHKQTDGCADIANCAAMAGKKRASRCSSCRVRSQSGITVLMLIVRRLEQAQEDPSQLSQERIIQQLDPAEQARLAKVRNIGIAVCTRDSSCQTLLTMLGAHRQR